MGTCLDDGVHVPGRGGFASKRFPQRSCAAECQWVFQVTGWHRGAGVPCEGLGRDVQPVAAVLKQNCIHALLYLTLYLLKAPCLCIVPKPCGLVAKGVVAKQFVISQGLSGRFLLQLLQLRCARGLLRFSHVMSLLPVPRGSCLPCCKPARKAGCGNMAQGLPAREWGDKTGLGEGGLTEELGKKQGSAGP